MGINRDQAGRPAVLDSASETQIEELERQFSEGDRQGWDTLVTSYGWSNDDGQGVWDWFGQRPSSSSGGQGSTQGR